MKAEQGGGNLGDGRGAAFGDPHGTAESRGNYRNSLPATEESKKACRQLWRAKKPAAAKRNQLTPDIQKRRTPKPFEPIFLTVDGQKTADRAA